MKKIVIGMLALMVILSGCSQVEQKVVGPYAERIEDAKEILKETDITKAETEALLFWVVYSEILDTKDAESLLEYDLRVKDDLSIAETYLEEINVMNTRIKYIEVTSEVKDEIQGIVGFTSEQGAISPNTIGTNVNLLLYDFTIAKNKEGQFQLKNAVFHDKDVAETLRMLDIYDRFDKTKERFGLVDLSTWLGFGVEGVAERLEYEETDFLSTHIFESSEVGYTIEVPTAWMLGGDSQNLLFTGIVDAQELQFYITNTMGSLQGDPIEVYESEKAYIAEKYSLADEDFIEVKKVTISGKQYPVLCYPFDRGDEEIIIGFVVFAEIEENEIIVLNLYCLKSVMGTHMEEIIRIYETFQINN